MYVHFSFLILSQSISLSTFILQHKSDNRLILSPLSFFLVSILSIADYRPLLGLLDRASDYLTDNDLQYSPHGFYLTLVSYLFLFLLGVPMFPSLTLHY